MSEKQVFIYYQLLGAPLETPVDMLRHYRNRQLDVIHQQENVNNILHTEKSIKDVQHAYEWIKSHFQECQSTIDKQHKKPNYYSKILKKYELLGAPLTATLSDLRHARNDRLKEMQGNQSKAEQWVSQEDDIIDSKAQDIQKTYLYLVNHYDEIQKALRQMGPKISHRP